MSARRIPLVLLSLMLLTPLVAHANMIGTGASPRAVAIGDLNEDGYADLVSGTNTDSTVCVSLGRGNDRFYRKVQYSCGSSVSGVTIADLNGDGHLDVLSCCPGIGKIGLRFGAGDGTLGPRNDISVSTPSMVVVGDFDENGIKDLAVATTALPSPAILLGTGGGAFGAPTYNMGTGGPGLAVGDLNGDGHLDVGVTNNAVFPYGIGIMLGTGTGTMGSQTLNVLPDAANSVVFADFNLDGKLDLAAAVGSFNNVYVKLGNGDGTFGANAAFATASIPSGLAVGDVNGDGKPDLAVTASNGNVVSVLIGTGAGTFNAKVDYPTGVSPRGVAVGPINNDATADLAIAASGSNSICVLLNNGGGTFPVMAGPVYVWATNDGSFTDGASWLPTRSTFGASDILVFNRGVTLNANTVTTTTIGQIVISGETQVAFNGFLTSPTLTVAGGTGDDAVIEEGSRMTLANSGNPVSFSMASGAQAVVYGDLNISGSSSRFQALSTNGIIFQSTGRATIGAGSSSTPFGNGTGGSGLNSVNFLYGSRLIAAAPFSVFGATAPNAVVKLGPGSRFRQEVAFNTDVSGRTFGDFEYNVAALGPAGISALTGNLPLTVDSLIVSQGFLSLESTGGGSIRGNIAIGSCSATALRVVPATPTTYHLNGSAPQFLRNPVGCSILRVYASPNVTWDLDNSAGVTLSGLWWTSSNFNFTHGNLGNVYTNFQLITDSTSTITGASQSTGWVTSYLTRRATAGGPMRVDVGDANHYLPVDLVINGFTSPGYMTCGAMPYDAADIANAQLDLSHLVHRTWLVHASNNAGNNQPPTFFGTLDANLPFVSSDVDAGSDPLQFVVRQSGWWNVYMWRATTPGIRTATSIQALGLTATSVDTLQFFSAGQPITPALSVFNASSAEGNGSGVQVEPQAFEPVAKTEPAALEPIDGLVTPLPLPPGQTRPTATLAAPLRVQSPGALSFRVRLSQTAIVPISVDYQTVDGTATVADGDYTPTSGTLTFAPGDSALDIVVPFGADSTPEHNETFGITLSNATGATIDTPTATGTILDDDDLIAPTAQVVYPNGGEVIHQNQQVTLQWTASDNVGVNGVDIQLLNGASFTTLASNYPNTGSYSWLSTGPASTKMKFRVVAHDDNHATTDNSDANWEISIYTIGVDDEVPVAFALAAPSPNPSPAGSNRIAFSVPQDARVRLTVHDVRGRTVAKLVDGLLPAGNHVRMWDSSTAAAGVYFVRFVAPGFHADQRLVVIR